jgi:alpha-ketoglutarate-dependent taurine dioxygenase
MSTAQNLHASHSRHAVNLDVKPLEPTIGAEIGGVDLSKPISDEVRDAIKATILQYKVVFFRDQSIDVEQQAAFAARFGKLYVHPSSNRNDKVSNIHKIQAADFARLELKKDDNTVEGGYHTDTSWRLVPTWGAVLRAIHLPEVGGDTIWVDAGAAYDGLSEELKARLEGLHVTHNYREALQRVGKDYPIVAHPIVRTHRETQRKTLWVNFTQRPYIVGVDLDENRRLLNEILNAFKKPEYQVRFSWRPGSVAFWDNRAAVHYAVRNYGDFPRLLERVLIEDEPQYADL